eukprot:jgi/Galph1/5226/GphlegSOOS_G3822.1
MEDIHYEDPAVTLYNPQWFLSEADKVCSTCYKFENREIWLLSAPQHMRQTLYGAYLRVWPSSIVLAKFLCYWLPTCFKGKGPLLELGAGVGFCGIATSLVTGYSVIASEGDKSVLPLLELNCRVATLVKPERLLWGNQTHICNILEKYNIQGVDCLFGADIVFQEDHIPLLVSTMNHCLTSSGIAILGFSVQFKQFESILVACLKQQHFVITDQKEQESVIIILCQKGSTSAN